MNRREFLIAAGVTAAGVLAMSTSYRVLNNGLENIALKRIELPITNLHPSLDGFRIAQLSDIHIGRFTRIELVRRAVALTNQLHPDFVVLTGDYIWLEIEGIFDLAPELAKLNARHGVVSIVGNHDVWEGVEILREGFNSARLPLYINQGLQISEGKGRIHLACLDDARHGHPDLQQAMQNWEGGTPVILLLHEPDPADWYSQDGRISLQLSGHSHGGQVRLPGIGGVILPYMGRKYDYRLFNVNGMWLYTNPGIGVVGVPVRYNCPPEITEITLTRI